MFNGGEKETQGRIDKMEGRQETKVVIFRS